MKRKHLETFYSVSETARFLGVGVGRMNYWIKCGNLPPPTWEIGSRKYYNEIDIKDIRYSFKQMKPKLRNHFDIQKNRKEEGYFNISAAARYLDIPVVTLRYKLKNETFPKPTHQLGADLYYWIAELEQYKDKYLKEYFIERALKLKERLYGMGDN